MPLGYGPATIDHVEPFQCSADGLLPAPVMMLPTAKQLEAVGQETPFNPPFGGPAGLGLGVTVHAGAALAGAAVALTAPATSAAVATSLTSREPLGRNACRKP